MGSRSVLPLFVGFALVALFGMAYMASARQRAAAEPVAAAQSTVQASGSTTDTALPLPAPAPAPAPKPRPARPRGLHRIAVVNASVPLRARPNGPVVAQAAARTEFGDRRALSVVTRRGAWLGVTATELPNGQVAWVHRGNRALHLRRTAYSLHADLSGRWLELRRNGRRIRRISVAVGRPGSETPTGRFAVTDKLNGGNYGPYYGCCILALSGHQTKLPAGWTGGDRLAIHGTDVPSAIGTAASAGCLRAADADLQVLMRRVPVGTPVFIRD